MAPQECDHGGDQLRRILKQAILPQDLSQVSFQSL